MLLTVLLWVLNLELTPGDTLLSKNKAGQIHFEETIEVQALGEDILFRNALNFAKDLKKAGEGKAEFYHDHGGKVVRKEGSFLVYTQGLFTPQVHGEISYTLQIEVDEKTYTYSLTDFVFHFYRRNRYGLYAPVSGKKKPLEEEKFAGMQDTWENHKQHTKQHVEQLVALLKTKMEEKPPGATKLQSQEKPPLQEEM